MKKFLFLLATFFLSNLYSQEVYKDYRDGELYLQLRSTELKQLLSLNPQQIDPASLPWMNKFREKYGITSVKRPFHQAGDHPTLPTVLKLNFSKVARIDAFIRELKNQAEVLLAEKVPLTKTDALPNDPSFPSYLNQINAQNAWNVFNGNSNITVAIVDNAVMWTHEDLVANTYTNTGEIPSNNIDDDGNGYIDDVNGYDVADLDNNAVPTNTAMDHGTHCAGIAGACTNNSLGIASIGWNIKIIPVKCAYNGASTTTINTGYEGIIYAAKAKARIISCSWGGSGGSTIEQTVIDYAWSKGCIVVASAGNAGNSTPNYPGAYNKVYCVASVNSSDIKSGFSNYGSWVDISAPGENIFSTIPSVSTGTYGNKSGTSMSTPLVAGLAALMLSKCSYLSSTDVLNCISSTAVNIYTLGGNSAYAAGSLLGAGRIDAFQAMNCANAFLSIAPVANFYAFPRNSCPFTPIQFYDSSLYAPTSYTWNFQGGTPASSSASAPAVSWSSPGTYSVSLTVSNANGLHTKNKTSYITISGPQNLPFVEGFESLPFLPAGWTAKNINYDNVYWQQHTGTGGFGTSTACAKFDNYNFVTFDDREEMWSPKFNFSNVHTVRLRYDVAYARFSNSIFDSLEVKYSLNCGATWSLVSIKGGTTLATRSDLTGQFIPSSSEWRKDTFDLSANTAGQNNVMFSFINRGHYGQAIYLDNINLFFPNPTLSINPLSPVCVNATVNPIAGISGAGSFSWNFPGGIPATSSQSNPAVSFSTAGIYTLELIGHNGTSSVSVTRSLQVLPYPVIVANSPSICSGNSAVLNFSGATTYTLNPGALTGSQVSVNPIVTTIYTITGSNGVCSSINTSTVFVNPSPTLTANHSTICSGAVANCTLTGAGSYTTMPGTIIGSSFTVSPLATTIYTVSGETGPCSSNLTFSVLVNPLPVISVNQPSICYGESATLTASGAGNYTWSSGSNSSSIVVSPLTSTAYVVSGSSLNCVSSQTSVVFVNPSFTVSAQSASNNVCSQVICSLSASGANSYSWSSGASGSMALVSPLSSSTYTVIGTVGTCTNQATVSITVIPTPPLSFSANPSYTLCAGSMGTLQVSGAYSTFYWGQPVVAGTVNVIYPQGNTTYTLNATDIATGCFTSSQVSVFVNTVNITSQNSSSVTCYGMCNGTVNASAGGGIAPYAFTLTPSGCTSLPCPNLCAGNYTLLAKDALGCIDTNTMVIANPVALSIDTILSSPAACSSCNDGSLQANVSGGTSPYTYSWIPSGGQSAQALNLLPGCYTLIVTDGMLCSNSSTACVSYATGLNAEFFDGLNLSVYPNPAGDLVHIELESVEFECQLFNSLGQLVIQTTPVRNKLEIKLTELSSGVYTLRLRSATHYKSLKLVIQD